MAYSLDGLAPRIIARFVSGFDFTMYIQVSNFAFCYFCFDVKFFLFLKIEGALLEWVSCSIESFISFLKTYTQCNN
jgi:hypothetical protein